MTPRPVVAAAIFDSLDAPSRLLCAARAYPPQLAGRFELPGGKIEQGEGPADALMREIAEELGTCVVLGAAVPGPAAPPSSMGNIPSGATPAAPATGWWPILGGRCMAVWLARIAEGAPEPRLTDSHNALRWVPLTEVGTLDWIGADLPIVQEAVRVALVGAQPPTR